MRRNLKESGPYNIVLANGRGRLVFIARRGTVNVAAVEKALNGCKAPADRWAV